MKNLLMILLLLIFFTSCEELSVQNDVPVQIEDYTITVSNTEILVKFKTEALYVEFYNSRSLRVYSESIREGEWLSISIKELISRQIDHNIILKIQDSKSNNYILDSEIYTEIKNNL